MNSKQINNFFKNLKKNIKNPKTALKYKNKFTLLVSVILSAQCTDKNVNNVTKDIYNKYFTPKHFLNLGEKKIQKLIRRIGLFRNKSKSIYNLSKELIEKHRSKIPGKFNDLIKLPGVGRKTANVILNELFNIPTIAVDTHIFRVSNRTKLAIGKKPIDVELGLEKIVPEKYKQNAHHLLILHGRYVCKARNPECYKCVVNDLCLFKNKNFNLKKNATI